MGGDEFPMIRFNLAATLTYLGRKREALDTARQYIREDPDGAKSDSARIMICGLRRSLAESQPEVSPSGEETHGIDESQPETPSSDGEARTFSLGADVSPPVKIHFPQPLYTTEARKNRIQGVVIVQTIIDKEGCATNLKVLKGLPDGLNEAAVAAIKAWVFRPATLDGKSVDVYYNLTVNFRLRLSPPR